ncbi:hypothetical protein GCM10018785_37990 [Streptomyces longispororuber]|uniref:HTH tetR-type domain-containing protein n=1 Tax=Streptomyces longispororuber TaxID=68230 RepID=A0A918ZRY9_9ACTN|nr:TetR/AcrR family transcriptional regulator [Streptomyces longispororuber]GHE65491.1 hypothetical protein GCM10018785_37990 [Streptomyces longispororuber]
MPPTPEPPAAASAAPARSASARSAPARSAPARPPSALRADARRNRDRILDAARAAFAAHGVDVPVSAIARRAGVGAATLYRHFPSRAELVTEAFAEQLAHCARVLDEALADPDPWRGFCSVIDNVCTLQVAGRGFTEAFLDRFPDAVDHDRERARVERGLARLIRRAQDAGALRPDFDLTDVRLILQANSAVVAGAAPGGEPAASRRLLAYLLQSFRADRARPLPPPAPLP